MAMYHPQSYATNETSQKLQKLIPMTDMTFSLGGEKGRSYLQELGWPSHQTKVKMCQMVTRF